MDSYEITRLLFGGTMITAIAAAIAITANVLNINDRFKKWRDERKKSVYKKSLLEGNPDFKFTCNFLSGTPPGICKMSVSLLNLSKDIKYIDAFQYHFEDSTNPTKYEPSTFFMNKEKWPKRMEHGERYQSTIDFSNTLVNVASQYWQKGFKVYCSCRTTTGDQLRTNSVDFDKLMSFLEPVSKDYQNLAILLFAKTGGSQSEIEVSLWQLQFFKRLTSHIAKQLQENGIPTIEYLMVEHGLIPQKDIWFDWYYELERLQIQPHTFEQFLRSQLK